MSCCSQMTRKEFLEGKLQNFRAFLTPFCTTDKNKARLEGFKNLDSVMPYLLQAAALSKAGNGAEAAAVEAFCAEFPGADDAFRQKVARYLSMFSDVLTS